MNWWQWLANFQEQAFQNGDEDRLRLVSLLDDAYRHREREPARVSALCEEGRRLALHLGEPWWRLAFQAMELAQFVHFNRDYRRAADLAVAAVLEARKPAYDGCPLRVGVYEDMLAVHFGIDPDGYADLIEQGFRELEGLVPDSLTTRLHFLNLRRWCAEQARRPEEHYAAAGRVLAVIAEHPNERASLHYSTFVYNGLCRVHCGRERWQDLDEAAALAEEASHRTGNQVELAEAYLWRAVAALHAGDQGWARRLKRQGVRRMDQLGVPPPDGYFEALAVLHEQEGRPEDALVVRERELALLRSQGRTISEVYCHRERCRLLAGFGRLTADDLAAARSAAGRLRHPESHLAELARLAL
jgi:hypothetical protein